MVISHPLGRDFVSRLKAVDDTVVPHDLPERDELERLAQVGGCVFGGLRPSLILSSAEFGPF